MFDRSSIGRTPLLPLTELAGAPLTATVLIKDESANPTGTHKDRKSLMLVERALRFGVDTLAIITSGNGGYSLAKVSEGTGLRIAAIVDEDVRSSIKDALDGAGAEVVECDLSEPLDSATIIETVRKHPGERIWDASNDGEESYEEIYHEVAHEHPDMVIAPLGSGELYLGLDRGIRRNGSTATLIGIDSTDPDTKADKLYAAYAPLRQRILVEQLCRSGADRGHMGIWEEQVEWCIRNAPPGLAAEPSALVVFEMVRRLRNQSLKMIVINTGQGLQ